MAETNTKRSRDKSVETADPKGALEIAYWPIDRIALNAGWDTEMLGLELRDLGDLGADLSALGFTETELADAFNDPTTGLTDEDAVPEVEEIPVTHPGYVCTALCMRRR
jgi:hypothetical protein